MSIEGKRLAEKRHDIILETEGDIAGVSTGVNLKTVGDAVTVDRIMQLAQINNYHVSLLPYFMSKLKNMQDGDGTLLDHTLILYGSPMGDPNVHNHRRVPLLVLGRASGALKGHMHVRLPDGTPAANVYLALLHRLGVDIETFGDSTGSAPI